MTTVLEPAVPFGDADARRRRKRPRSLDGAAMDIDEFLDLPDDGADRWLLDGVVHEWLPATRDRKTIRTLEHSDHELSLGSLLKVWAKASKFAGKIHSGEVGVHLNPDHQSVVGADIIVRRLETPVERRGKRSTILAGVPILAVEILSESDRVAALAQKVATYVDAGVPLVWIVDTFQKTIQVYRGSMKPETLLAGDTLDGGAELPGFSVPLSEVFE